jgi:putative endonuclease
MMKNLGGAGENFVADYLIAKGFVILAQNYRQFFGEVDIIAHKRDLYVFVEVKTRSVKTVAMECLISKSKQQKIIKTAKTFIAQQKIRSATFRFDVALLIKTETGFAINYLENAFIEQDTHYDY